jgi:hypothetical protein
VTQSPELSFEQSPIFLLLCLLIGVIYAFVLYQKNGPWSKNTNIILFVLRALSVTILAALLVSPIIKQINNTVEKPTIVFAIDNSTSLAEFDNPTKLNSLKNDIKNIAIELNAKGFETDIRTLDGSQQIDNINFNQTSTNLNQLLNSIKSDYESRNLAGAVLVTDGIYNEGMSPEFGDYNFEINTLGIGDTIPKSDIILSSLQYNRLSYQGNKFPIVAQIQQQGFDNELVSVSISNGSKTVATQQVKLSNKRQVQEVKFLIEAKNSGYQRYAVTVTPLSGELTTLNNSKNAYVEIIKGKEVIALIATSPHPDIKALRSAIETNMNYEFQSFILSNGKDVERLKNSAKKFDLVIYHQIPDRGRQGLDLLQEFEKSKISKLIIVGPQTELRLFNNENGVLDIKATAGEIDKVTASFNQNFSSFKLSDELQASFDQFPPISVPFGKYEQALNAEVLLYQRVGSITTKQPLLAIKTEDEQKLGVMMGDGLWKWKLTDYATFGNNNRFNELVSKLVQFLSTREDKRKFKVYPIKNEFLKSEGITFETETYNDLFERIYGNKIDLILTNEQGKQNSYSYITSEVNSSYQINDLEEGVYQFSASTRLKDQTEKLTGTVVVKELQLENINLTSDFQLLRKLAKETGGSFFEEDDLNELSKKLDSKKPIGVLHSSEALLPFINIVWIFFLILILISSEWFLRKYSGSY